MKTYCKPAKVNVESAEFNSVAVHKAFAGKLNKREFRRLLTDTGLVTSADIASERVNNSVTKILPAIDAVAAQMTDRIIKRDLQLKPVRQFKRMDGISQKIRDLNQESAEQQVLEYICVEALMPLFNAKILPCQCGSIPDRGQTAGKRQIERILRKKYHCDKLDVIKGDIRHAYQSVSVECVMKLLRRDIGKNKPLLWLVEATMDNYPNGRLMIGGYLPTWLFNYVMSYVLRYMLSLHRERRGVRHNFCWACVCYADDFAIFGKRSNLIRAMKETTRWCKQALNLEIKGVWNMAYFVSYYAEKQQYGNRRAGSKKRTPGIDMVGYVVRRTYTIIRGKIFVRIRRQILRAARELESIGYIPWWRAYKIVSYYGWLKNSDSQAFRRNYGVKKIMKAAKRSVSIKGKQIMQEAMRNERKLCCEAC